VLLHVVTQLNFYPVDVYVHLVVWLQWLDGQYLQEWNSWSV